MVGKTRVFAVYSELLDRSVLVRELSPGFAKKEAVIHWHDDYMSIIEQEPEHTWRDGVENFADNIDVVELTKTVTELRDIF